MSYISPNSGLSIHNIVSCTYKTQISNQKFLYITITWCNKLFCQGFFIRISEKKFRFKSFINYPKLMVPNDTRFLENLISKVWTLCSPLLKVPPVLITWNKVTFFSLFSASDFYAQPNLLHPSTMTSSP